MDRTAKFKISKIDAARRQLHSAIVLYFNDADPVPIHTLTAASYNILRDITKAHGKPSMLVKDRMIERIKPGREKFVRDKINEAENFFKHADKDPAGTLDFSPVETELLMFDACLQYQIITDEAIQALKIYELWFLLHNKNLFNLPAQISVLTNKIGRDLGTMAKNEFFKTVSPLFFANNA